MTCKSCAREIPDASVFCNHCGAPQKEDAPAKDPSALSPRGAAVPESELWRGRFSGKALAHLWFLWFLALGGLGYIYWGALSPETREKIWVLWLFAGTAAVGPVYIAGRCLVEKVTVRYRLTTHRLFKETGIINRNLDEVELVRVDDVAVRQNVLQRIFNVGKITVLSTDASHPRTELVGISRPIEVKEMIRTHVRKWRDGALHMETL